MKRMLLPTSDTYPRHDTDSAETNSLAANDLVHELSPSQTVAPGLSSPNDASRSTKARPQEVLWDFQESLPECMDKTALQTYDESGMARRMLALEITSGILPRHRPYWTQLVTGIMPDQSIHESSGTGSSSSKNHVKRLRRYLSEELNESGL